VIDWGPLPTGTAAATAPVRGSILETVESRSFATQTAPSPTASAAGPWPTLIVAIVSPEAGSICATTPSS